MDNLNGTLFESSVLPRIQDKIEDTARDLYFNIRMYLSIDLDDLIQEGMFGAWVAHTRYNESKTKNEDSINGYCMMRAKGAMQDFIRKHRVRYEEERSLEAHLEVKTEKGTMQREVEDKHTERTETPKHKRVTILNALGRIPKMQRIAIMAAFQIEDAQDIVTIQEETGLSHEQYIQAKCRGVKKLEKVLKLEDLVLA